MDTRCPNCGACNSLDSLIGHTEAGKLLETTLKSFGVLEKPMIQYLSLFRPAKTRLRLERANKIISEILPDILRGAISRNRIEYPAPAAAWIYAIEEALKARDSGKLVTPLDGHGWLYTVISRWKPEPLPAQHTAAPANDDYAPVPITTAFRSTTPRPNARPALRGIPPEQMFSHIEKHRQAGETSDECYQRLLKQEQQGA